MQTIFIVMTLLGVLLPIFAPFNNRQAGRRLFWAGFFIAFVSAFFITYPPDWKAGIVFSLLAAFVMLLNAYFGSPYLKFHGKIYAFHVSDSLPNPSPDGTPPAGSDGPDYDPAPDSYSGVATAKKSWWALVFVMATCVLCVVVPAADKPWWMTPTMAAIGVIIPIGYAYGDASWNYPIARGQRFQFVVISLVTVGVFTVLYFVGYRAGKRWPLRRKQAMEYRAHPRHQKRYP
jgi:drug/metabolite transporter (DMT)-like permease